MSEKPDLQQELHRQNSNDDNDNNTNNGGPPPTVTGAPLQDPSAEVPENVVEESSENNVVTDIA